MSFVFPSWETAFSSSFYDDAKAMLETALNKGNKPPVIQGHIEVVDLNMGSQPPTLTLLEVGDLSLDRFRGILRLGYQGDAWITVRCLVQANPLSHNPNLIPSSTLPISTPLLASQPLLVPMTLRLSRLHLRAILILVVSKAKGITLVFKNDPLQNVDVSSTFDSVEVIRGYLQQEIEGQLREMFREDLPGIIHRLSQRWFSSQGGTVETPYREGQYDTYEEEPFDEREREREREAPSVGSPSVTSTAQNTPKRKALHRAAAMRAALSESPTSYTVFPDIENYDPTYGLRPEGLPTHSGYEAFGRLWEKSRVGGGRGLGSLMGGDDHDDSEGESGSEDEEEVPNFEIEDHVEEERPQSERPQFERPLLRQHSSGASSVSMTPSGVTWETFPAVGGGVITRPRVFHSQSQIRAPSESGFSSMPSPAGTAGTATGGSVTARASSIGTSTVGSLRPATVYTPAQTHHHPLPPLRRTMTVNSRQSRPESLSALALQHSLASFNPHVPHIQRPTPLIRAQSMRGQSRSHSRTGSVPTRPLSPPQAVHRPSRPMSMDGGVDRPRQVSLTTPLPGRGITMPLNNSVSQLATLSLSANTLSPYARSHEHIAVRSFPHLGRGGSAPGHLREDGQNSTPEVKARRKRIFRLGGSSRAPSLSPDIDDDHTPPLEWDDDRVATSSSGGVVQTAPSAGRSASRSSRGYPFPKIPE